MKIKNKKLMHTVKKFTDVLIERINEVGGDWLTPWLPVKRKDFLPRNLSGRHYSGGNTFMLLLSSLKKDYRTPVFLTFLQADNIGVRVKYKEHPFPVYHISYMYYNYQTKDKISISDYEKLSDIDKNSYSPVPTPKCYDVFNLDQTNYAEAYPQEWAQLMAKHAIEPQYNTGYMYSNPLLEDIINNQKWVCPFRIQLSNRAYYSLTHDTITLPYKNQFENGETFYGTALHEMIHSTSNSERLNRLKAGDSAYAREELVAELSAALMSYYMGIEKRIQKDHVTYLKYWLSELNENPEFLMDILKDVVQAVKFTCTHIQYNPFEQAPSEDLITLSKTPKKEQEQQLFVFEELIS